MNYRGFILQTRDGIWEVFYRGSFVTSGRKDVCFAYIDAMAEML